MDVIIKKRNSERVILDEFYWHEALDRTSMVVDILSDQVATHPVFVQDKDLKKEIDKAIGAICDVYLMVGKKIIELENKNEVDGIKKIDVEKTCWEYLKGISLPSDEIFLKL